MDSLKAQSPKPKAKSSFFGAVWGGGQGAKQEGEAGMEEKL